MEKEKRADEIVAAGGVVIDSEKEDAPLVLLVHRPKYDDWSFPKGKMDPGETVEETALREVREETGLECRVIRELGTIRYNYEKRDGEVRPKVVHYFLMEAAGGSLAVNKYEIDRAEWLNPDEAARALKHEHDKQLLASLIASGLK